MQKIVKVLPQPVARIPLSQDIQREDLAEASIDPISDSNSITPRHDESLRGKLELIQRTKETLGINSLAAVDPFTFFGVAAGGGAAYKFCESAIKSWWRNSSLEAVAKAYANATHSLTEKYFNDDLVSNIVKERILAVNRLKTGQFKNAQNVTKAVKDAFFNLLDCSYIATDKDHEDTNRLALRNLACALEGLYQRSDVTLNIEDLEKIVGYLNNDDGKLPFLLIDALDTQEHLLRIIVNNWKVPTKDYKVPNPKLGKIAYRLKIYNTMLKTLIDENDRQTIDDPLFLKTPVPDKSADKFKERVKELHDALVEIYDIEREFNKQDKKKHSPFVVQSIQAVLENSPAISRLQWSKAAQDEKRKDEENERRCVAFTQWAGPAISMSEVDLRTSFTYLFDREQDPDMVKDLGALETLFEDKEFKSEADLNEGFRDAVKLLDLEEQIVSGNLNEKNLEKGLFIFRYLNALTENNVKIITNERSDKFKNLLNTENRELILRLCKIVINDEVNFRSTPRGYEFFTEPHLDSVPGQAIALYHKLTRCFDDNNGYVDVHGLKELVLRNAIENIHPTVDKVSSGFIFNGPPGTGKSFFAEALANQLAIPLFILNPGNVTLKDRGWVVTYGNDKQEMTVGDFFDMIKKTAPCVLLLDEVDELLPPRKKTVSGEQCVEIAIDKADNKTPAGKFLSDLNNLREEGKRSNVIVIMTTNFPEPHEIDIDKLNDKGYSAAAELALYKYVDYGAIRPGRVDHRVFSFHRFGIELHGEAFARRFLQPYIESGQVQLPIDFHEIGQVAMKYPPKTIEKVFGDVVQASTSPVTQQQLLDELKLIPTLEATCADPATVKLIDGILTYQVQVLGNKRIVGAINLGALSFKARGLSREQIKKAIEELTPVELTQENILEAFQRVREQ